MIHNLSASHGLPEAGGGLYDHYVEVEGGETQTEFGGMIVPTHLYGQVAADLRALDYELREADTS